MQATSICRSFYWVSLLWIWTEQMNYISFIPLSPNTCKKWEYNAAVHKIFMALKEAYDSFRR